MMEVREFDTLTELFEALRAELRDDEEKPSNGFVDEMIAEALAEIRQINARDAEQERVFRPQYRELSKDENNSISKIKAQAAALLHTIQQADADSRCMCIARTRLEEAVMWAVKGIT